MKKLFLVSFIITICSLQSIAQSMLRVRMADNSRINISVDGRYFGKTGTSITVGELPYGDHHLRIFQYVQNRRGRMFEEPIFTGMVRTYHGMITLFIFDKYTGETDITEQEISAFTFNHPPNGDLNRNKDQYNQSHGTPRVSEQQNNYQDNAESQNNAAQSKPYVSPDRVGSLTDEKIKDLKTKVTAKNTDVEKMTLLKEALKNEKLTVTNIAGMFDWFIFESSRVDFAKWAYTNTVDKDYYEELESKLSYKAYVEDLDKFIKDNK